MSMKDSTFHRAFGTYGIYFNEGKLLVIHKQGGPYTYRYDLPGGSLEDFETLPDALDREFQEETGLTVRSKRLIGAFEFFIQSDWHRASHLHHIGVFFHVLEADGKPSVPKMFDGQDSTGSSWVSRADVDMSNASPLVLKAFDYLENPKTETMMRIENWIVKQYVVS
ncbi:NUDIX hydrolase [Exiguobacterium artemiae]|uniref:NUDIX hydrolase n=1 Tax=Exiguobacterium artemiae TaxID=340145 RepID=UPI000A8037E7|nr:NUDIX hydrolase [Exiguobacterium sibiricum]